MAEGRARYRAKRTTVPRSPINFRMPTPLRARLRRFAEAKGLGESDALRLVVADHLDEIEDERELLEAERWQFKQAYRTWRRWERGGMKTVGWDAIEKTFDDAFKKLELKRSAKK